MDDTVMVALVGEQPIPNLLACRYERPKAVVLVETDRTRATGERLATLLQAEVVRLQVPPYDIGAVRERLTEILTERGWGESAVYNLTGGTKPMMLAAYGLAQETKRPFIYLQSEGGKSLVYRYDAEQGLPRLVNRAETPALLTIDDYLRAHVRDYRIKPFDQWFERLVYEELDRSGQFDELMANVVLGPAQEVDLVLRKGNYVGFAELKSGKEEGHKAGIDQLMSAADKAGFGTYTRKLLINDRQLDQNVLALAAARGIRVISLKGAQPNRPLPPADRDMLIAEALRWLGRFGDRP